MSTALFYNNVTSSAVAIGKPRFSQPFNGDNGEYKLEQDYQQDVASFAPLALNVTHPVYPSYYLTGESQLNDLGGGQVKWTRTYCQVPATRSDYSTMNYNFIGFYGANSALLTAGQTQPPGRQPFTDSVTCRIQNDYYLVDPSTYLTAAAIPVILEQKYYVPAGYYVGTTFTPTYINPIQSALHGLAIRAIWDTSGPYNTQQPIACVPTRTQYEALVSNGSEIVAEGSQLSRWQGNIYQRVTKYVIAI